MPHILGVEGIAALRDLLRERAVLAFGFDEPSPRSTWSGASLRGKAEGE